MLFIFPAEDVHGFWMKNVLIPLDLIFLDRNREIVDIQTMEPQPGTRDAALKVYQPPRPVLYALEMNGGLAKRYGFEVGMQVALR